MLEANNYTMHTYVIRNFSGEFSRSIHQVFNGIVFGVVKRNNILHVKRWNWKTVSIVSNVAGAIRNEGQNGAIDSTFFHNVNFKAFPEICVHKT